MKISPVLVAVVAGKTPAPREIRSCGGTITDQLETNIQSFGYPGDYSNDLNCTWIVQSDCARSFTITPNAFDLQGHYSCRYDKLTFGSDGTEQTLSFCGGSRNSDSGSGSGNDSDSYSYYSYSYYSDMITNGSEVISSDGLDDSITIVGNELSIHFRTDSSVVRSGFDLDITANCVDLTAQCFEYPNFNGRATAFYETIPGFDVVVPSSDFSQSVTYERSCNFECIGTAGCFKVYHDEAQNTCELRGDELAPVAGLTKAFDGRYCDGKSGRVWTDAVTNTRMYCRFYSVESADRFLDYLNRQNPDMLEWVTVKRVNDGGAQRDRISSSKIWSFSVATDRTASYGTWYTFQSVTYWREFLPSGNRTRRNADSEEIFRTLAEEYAAEFEQNLDIGDIGAELLETEEPVIEVQILEEVVDPPADSSSEPTVFLCSASISLILLMFQL